ncbi:MAG: triacylglycerol lipase [Myxococcales bacterium]|nr:triacylglycerol lipase [Myxococcales bacterium]
MKTHQIYLIPGFFGFSSFGEFRYFAHVREILEEYLDAAGVDARVHYARTSPTSSIRRRAARVAAMIAESSGAPEDPIHLIGHSTGGLDARLLTAPGVQLKTSVDIEAIARRVRSVITVATPHYGTPVAAFFTSLLGQKVLRLISLGTVYVLRFGQLPLWVVQKLAGAVVWSNNRVEVRAGVLDQIYTHLLQDFSPDRRAVLAEFFAEVTADQSLLPQLSPEGMDLFNAHATLRPKVRYGSVVCMAPEPGWRSALRAGVRPYAQATHGLYRLLHARAKAMSESDLPGLTPDQEAILREVFGRLPTIGDNDGMVPALSQVFGEVIHATWADHLDVIGHFGDHHHHPPHIDWLVTGARFDRRHFESLWADVARFLVGAQLSSAQVPSTSHTAWRMKSVVDRFRTARR